MNYGRILDISKPLVHILIYVVNYFERHKLNFICNSYNLTHFRTRWTTSAPTLAVLLDPSEAGAAAWETS